MVDFNAYREVNLRDMMKTGGNAQGGLTVRDYFAAVALQGLISKLYTENSEPFEQDLVEYAYDYADKMMKERNKPLPQPTPSVEEAFGLDK